MTDKKISLPDIAEFINQIELTLNKQTDWKSSKKDLKINFKDLKSFLNIPDVKTELKSNKTPSKITKIEDALLEKLKGKITNKKGKEETKDSEDLEDVVQADDDDSEDNKDSKDKDKIVLESIDYSALERNFHIEQQLYSKQEQSYLSNIMTELSNPYENESNQVEAYSMSETLTMDEAEAHDTISRIMADATTGSYSEVSHKDKERLSNFANFNPALSKLYQTTSITPTGDVDFRYM